MVSCLVAPALDVAKGKRLPALWTLLGGAALPALFVGSKGALRGAGADEKLRRHREQKPENLPRRSPQKQETLAQTAIPNKPPKRPAVEQREAGARRESPVSTRAAAICVAVFSRAADGDGVALAAVRAVWSRETRLVAATITAAGSATPGVDAVSATSVVTTSSLSATGSKNAPRRFDAPPRRRVSVKRVRYGCARASAACEARRVAAQRAKDDWYATTPASARQRRWRRFHPGVSVSLVAAR